jgi:chromosome segregation ATPase
MDPVRTSSLDLGTLLSRLTELTVDLLQDPDAVSAGQARQDLKQQNLARIVKQELQDQALTIETLKRENEEHKATIESMRHQNEEPKATNESVEHQSEEQEAKIKSMEHRIETQKSTIIHWRGVDEKNAETLRIKGAIIHEQQIKIQEQQIKIQGQETKIKKLEKRIAQMKGSSKIKEELRALEAERTKADEELQERERELKMAEEESKEDQ